MCAACTPWEGVGHCLAGWITAEIPRRALACLPFRMLEAKKNGTAALPVEIASPPPSSILPPSLGPGGSFLVTGTQMDVDKCLSKSGVKTVSWRRKDLQEEKEKRAQRASMGKHGMCGGHLMLLGVQGNGSSLGAVTMQNVTYRLWGWRL